MSQWSGSWGSGAWDKNAGWWRDSSRYDWQSPPDRRSDGWWRDSGRYSEEWEDPGDWPAGDQADDDWQPPSARARWSEKAKVSDPSGPETESPAPPAARAAAAEEPEQPPPSDGKLNIEGREFTPDEMAQLMDNYYKRLAHDTFCGQATAELKDLPWSWRDAVKAGQPYFRAPPPCQLRQRLHVNAKGVDDAAPLVAKALMERMYEVGEVELVDNNGQMDLAQAKLKTREPQGDLAKRLTLPPAPMQEAGLRHRELERWDADDAEEQGAVFSMKGLTMDAHVVVLDNGEEVDVAFVSQLDAGFHYRLPLEDLCQNAGAPCSAWQPAGAESSGSSPRFLRLEAAAVAWEVEDDIEQPAQVVRAFHEMVMHGHPGFNAGSAIYVACVRIAGPGVRVDFKGMQKAVERGRLPEGTPRWLAELCDRVTRLRILEHQIELYAPVRPAPNPLIMEAILHCKADRSIETREALAVVGKGVVREMAALAGFTDHLWDNAERQSERIKMLVDDDRCAKCMLLGEHGDALLSICSRVDLGTPQEAAEVFFALAGAHFLEAGASAVAHLWQWLTEGDELRSALRHMAAPPAFAGRTETYTELWELKGGQLLEMLEKGEYKPHAECKAAKMLDAEQTYLFVVYQDADHTLYRKGRQGPEELRHQRPPPEGEWRLVVWDPNLQVHCSPTRKRESGMGGIQLQPLPNKITACLHGRSLMSQATLKSKRSPGVMKLLKLREMCKNDPREPDRIEVIYVEGNTILSYCRSDTGFGLEIAPDGKERALGYSEVEKTLLSPHWKKPLPSLVIDWVCGVQSVAQLVPLPKDAATDRAALEVHDSQGRCRWQQGGQQYSCRNKLEHGRYIFVGREQGANREEELWYHKDNNQWHLSSSGKVKAVIIPEKAVAKMTSEIDDADWVDTLRMEIMKKPWLRIPSLCMRQFICLVPGQGLSEAEKILQHKFSNPMLLVEALTHCSAAADASPSCERLAILGEETASSFVLQRVCRQDARGEPAQALPVAAPPTQDADEPPASRSLAASRQLVTWRKALESPAESCQPANSTKDVFRHVLACCNHSSYARSCVRLGLEKLLIHGSPELEASVKRYQRVWKRSPKDSEAPPAGAPRVLGDVYLAVIAALVLDGQRAKAEQELEEHMKSCEPYLQGLREVDAHPDSAFERMLDKAPLDEILAASSIVVTHAGAAINSLVLAPPPPAAPAWTIQEKEQAKRRMEENRERLLFKVRSNRDVHVIDAQVSDEGFRPYGGVSPRAARIHGGRSPDDPGEAEPEECGVCDEPAEKTSTEGAVYCKDCQMWLNGPTQWEDHKIGKKHRRNHGRNEKGKKSDAKGSGDKIVPDAMAHQ